MRKIDLLLSPGLGQISLLFCNITNGTEQCLDIICTVHIIIIMYTMGENEKNEACEQQQNTYLWHGVLLEVSVRCCRMRFLRPRPSLWLASLWPQYRYYFLPINLQVPHMPVHVIGCVSVCTRVNSRLYGVVVHIVHVFCVSVCPHARVVIHIYRM